MRLILLVYHYLTQLQPIFHFYTSWKHEKTSGFKKTLYEVTTSGLQLSFNIILIAFNLSYNKNKLCKTLGCFDFLEKGLRIVSPAHFGYDFSRKTFLMLYSINWPNFIVWLPLVLLILGNVYCNCFLTWLWRYEFWN